MASCYVIPLLLLLVFQQAATLIADNLIAIAKETSSHRQRRHANEIVQELDVESLHIDSMVVYRYANTVIYSKIKNVASVAQEVHFVAVLPEKAFITGFAITTEQKTYKAYIMEKSKARTVYEVAKFQGKTAGHVELSRRDMNLFIVSMNVEAYGKVSFNMTYEELLFRELGAYSVKNNIVAMQTVKDMFVKVDILDNADITLLEVPDLRLKNEIDENPSENPLAQIVRPSRTRAVITWSPTPDQQKAISSDGIKGLLEVRYDVDRTKHSNEILMNNGYFVHFFAPQNLVPLKKHVVFVLDHSSSMRGRKLEQLKNAMMTIIDELDPRDLFSLVIFSTDVLVWTSSGHLVPPVNLTSSVILPPTDKEREAAKTMIIYLLDSHMTNIYDALQTALQVIKLGQIFSSLAEENHNKSQPMIIFLTDGQPNGRIGDPDKILQATTNGNKELSAAIHCLAFGDDADFTFLKKVSFQNSGVAQKIYEAADASLQLNNFFRTVSTPLLSNVVFQYVGDEARLSSLTTMQFPVHYSGSELVVAGHYHPLVQWKGDVFGMAEGNSLSFPAKAVVVDGGWYPERIPLVQNASDAPFIERLWAYLTIYQLLDISEETPNGNETLRQQAMDLALKYSFVTPLTSLVVVKPDNRSNEDLRPVRGHNIFQFRGSPFGHSSRNNPNSQFIFVFLAVILCMKSMNFEASHCLEKVF